MTVEVATSVAKSGHATGILPVAAVVVVGFQVSLSWIFVVIAHVVVPKFSYEVVASVMKHHTHRFIVQLGLYDSFAVVLVEILTFNSPLVVS